MTNREVYKNVFGFYPPVKTCPTNLCSNCPLYDEKSLDCIHNVESEFWNAEYTGEDGERGSEP